MGFYVLWVNSFFPSLFIKNKYSLHPLSLPFKQKKKKQTKLHYIPHQRIFHYLLFNCCFILGIKDVRQGGTAGGIVISGEGEQQTQDSCGSAISHPVVLGVISKPSQLAW